MANRQLHTFKRPYVFMHIASRDEIIPSHVVDGFDIRRVAPGSTLKDRVGPEVLGNPRWSRMRRYGKTPASGSGKSIPDV